jgi:hypothetical protein
MMFGVAVVIVGAVGIVLDCHVMVLGARTVTHLALPLRCLKSA